MKSLFIFFPVLLICVICRGQAPLLTFTVAPDTSYLLFEGMPRLMVTKSGSGRSTSFQMARRDFKSLLDVTSYLQNSRAISLSSEATFRSLVSKKDSTISILKLKYEAEVQRTENFKQSYEDLKLVNKTSHEQLNACIEDMKKLNSEKEKSKGWTFVKGVLWGLVIGSVGGIVAGAAL